MALIATIRNFANTLLSNTDIENKRNNKSEYEDIQDNIVGRKVYTFDELIQVIATNDYTMDASARQKILDKFWGETSGKNSCELVFEKLQLLD